MRDQRGAKLIDKEIQGGLVLRMLCYFMAYLGVSMVVAFALQMFADPFQPFSSHLAKLWEYQGPFLITGLCLLPVFANDMVKFSHRFVGPIRRVCGVIRRASEGEIDKPFQFRENDHWQELATDLSTLLEQLKKFHEESESEDRPKKKEMETEEVAH